MTAPPIITLTTDFGLMDAYVGVMKGVILTIEPSVHLVDLSHDIQPQRVDEGAFLLLSAYHYFPPTAVHLAVVDPGVGTSRKALAIQTAHGVFVGPDNGLFSLVLDDQDALSGEPPVLRGAHAVQLTNPRYRRPEVSNTFHGRDVFAPAAAYYVAGIPLDQFGPALDRVTLLPYARPTFGVEGVAGVIVHVDRFGNAITNLRAEDVPPSPTFELSNVEINGLSSSYQDAHTNALIGSTGRVEFAVRNGDAAKLLGLQVGAVVRVRGGTW